ncbi:cation:proton antiporter [bacterium]|nr:cation:proton antiporter [bacterium]
MEIDFWKMLLDFLMLIGAATFLGVLFERIRLSALLGYLAAGILLGPGAFKLIEGSHGVTSMAELGVALLLFSIGLEFSWRRLRAHGRLALLGGSLQIGLTILIATILCLGMGVGLAAAVAIGAMASPSSTAGVLRMLGDRAELEAVHGRASLGILLFQDLALVPLVLLVSALGGSGTLLDTLWTAGKALGLAAGLIGLFHLLGQRVLPGALRAAVMTRNRELPILFATLMCFGAAWVFHAAKLSPALGAFIAGMVLAESPFAMQLRTDVKPLKTIFVTVFFASIGMLADLRWIADHLPLVIATVAGVLVIKAVIVTGVVRFIGLTPHYAIATGLCLAQVGEFSFVLAGIGHSMNVISPEMFKLVAAVTVATLMLTPFLVAFALPVAAKLTRKGASAPEEEGTAPAEGHMLLQNHAIIVGLGPAGRQALAALRGTGAPVLVLELNPETIENVRKEGLAAEVGDATDAEVLEHVHIEKARVLVVTLPDHRTTLQIIQEARKIAPSIRIITRARLSAYAEALKQAGADVVLDEEVEVGQRLGKRLVEIYS